MDKTGQRKIEIIIKGTLITNIMMMPGEDPKDKEAFVLLITNLQDWNQCREIFRRRWPIECCFKHMKSNGFNLEQLHLDGQHKIELLFGILSFVYVLAIHQGIINHYEEVIPIKEATPGKAYRKQSLFRFGLFHLKRIVKELKQLIELLMSLFIRNSRLFKSKELIFEKTIVQS